LVFFGSFSLFFCLLFFFFHWHVFTIFHFCFGLPNTVSSRSHYFVWWRLGLYEQDLLLARQVSNGHEPDLVTNKNVQFRPCYSLEAYILESLFADPVRENPAISPATGRFLVKFRNIIASHVLLCL